MGAKDDDWVPEGAHISDDEESVDSSVGPLSESEGEIFKRDGSPQRDDDVARTPPPPPLNSAPEGATAPQPHPPEQASEGAGPHTSRRRPKKWPSPAWERDKDSGKLRRLELNKLNRELFALTCGPQNPPPKAKKLSKKRKRLNYKQYKLLLRDQGDTSLNKMRVEESCPTIAELLASPLAEFITLAANDCGYSGTAKELIVNYAHPFFLKAKAAVSKEDNPNWHDATTGDFADEYWEAMRVEIKTLESMGAWEVVEREEDMNVI